MATDTGSKPEEPPSDDQPEAPESTPEVPVLPIPDHGAVLALDYGTKRVGIAVTDQDRRFIFPRDTLHRSTLEEDWAHFSQVAKDDQIALLLVGLPINADGTEGGMAKVARKFAADLAAHLELPFTFMDERYTSQEAEEQLRLKYPRDTRKRRQLKDRAAATIILRSWLDY